jgi:DNA-binding beta-propeller fold protein YncE
MPAARRPPPVVSCARRSALGALALALTEAACGMLAGPSAPPPAPGAIVASIAVGAPPTYLAISPDGANVYAASDGLLSVIRTADNSVIATLPINPSPTGLAVSPDGAHAYVTNLFSVTLSVLDTASNTLGPAVTMFLQRVRGGFGRMAVAPDGRTIYVANTSNRAFGVLDLAGGASNVLTPTVAPVDVAITPDGKTVYYAGCKSICTPGFVQVFDTGTHIFKQAIAIDGNPYRIALSPDATRAYTANLTGPSLSVVDLASGRLTTNLPVPVQPTGLAVTRDGSLIYVASQTAGTLTVIDAASLAARASAAIAQAREVVVSPDGRRAYVSSGDRVVVVDTRALLAG